MANPLDSFARKPASWDRNFRIKRMPSIREAVSGKNLLAGLAAHDEAAEAWRVALEQSIAERLASTSSTATTSTAAAAAVVAPAASPAPASSPASAPVTSVNSKTGDVSLTTDDIIEGLTNLYMTIGGWLDILDAYGFSRNNIPLGESVDIPAGRNWVCGGPLTVDGTLTIEGYFINLPIP